MTVEQSTPTTLLDSDCTLRVVVQMAFINDTVLRRDENGDPVPDANGDVEMLDDTVVERIVACWLESARQIWHNQWLDPLPPHWWLCREVEFVFLRRTGWPVIPEEQQHFHKVTLKYDMPGGSWVIMPTAAEPRATCEWDIEERHEVVAHEIGHILKLPDEYDQTDLPEGDYHDLSQDPRCLMLSTQANVVMPSSHVHSILADLDAPTNFSCCTILHPIDFARAWLQRLRRPPLPLPGPPPEFPPDPREFSPDALFELVRDARGQALARIGNWVGSRSAFDIDLLTKGVLGKPGSNPKQRWLAVISLGQVRETDRAAAQGALRHALEDPDVSVRMHAARSLHRLGSSEGVPMLIAALSSDETMIRQPAILARIYADRMLKNISGSTVGFLPYASEAIRNQGIQRWTAWWKAQGKRGN